MIHPNAHEIANDIRLRRSQHPGAFVVVEGRDDHHFIRRFTLPEICDIIIAQGKQTVCEVIEILDDDGFSGALGIIDADFDRIEAVPRGSPNLVTYECHDLETMLLCSPALQHILIEFGSSTKLAALGHDVLSALFHNAFPLGCLRLYSLRSGLGLRFDGLNYSRCINRATFAGSNAQMISEVKNHSQRHDLSSEYLSNAIQRIKESGYSRREICTGPDLIEILLIGLRSKFGNQVIPQFNADLLRSSLRLSYSEHDFMSSELGANIGAWENRFPGYKVLARADGSS